MTTSSLRVGCLRSDQIRSNSSSNIFLDGPWRAMPAQDKHGSIPTQLQEVRELAKREGWRIVSEHSDEGFSAYNGNRGPGLEAAKQAAAKAAAEYGTTCMLVAWRSDRFARGAGDKPGAADSLVEIWHEMRRQNVQLRTVRNDYTMHDPVLLAVEAKRIHEESKQKSADVIRGLQRRREAGRHHGSPRPFGVEYRDGEQVPNEAEVPHVQRIFGEYVAGHAQQAISRGLNDDKIPTTRGGKWYQGTVRAILANDVYVKLDIIDEATFEKTAQLREAARKSYLGGRHSVGRHLFRKGMLRCECGAPMVTRTQPNRASEPYEVYICYEWIQDKDRCSMPPLRRADLDEAVFDYFNRVALDRDATKAALQDAQDRRLAEIRALVAENEREATRLDNKEQRIERDYLAGDLPAKQYGKLTAKIEEGQAGNRAEGERLRKQSKKVERWTDLKDAQAEMEQRLAEIRSGITGEIREASDLDAVRAVLRRLFESFVVSMPKDGRARLTPKRRLADGFELPHDWDEPGASGALRPRRVPLVLAEHEKTEADSLVT
jgi:site-specific DNA recombinase